MWPYLIGAGVIFAGYKAIKKYMNHPANLPPELVDQGVADPTTGKTIVTLQDEQQAFQNVQAASAFPAASKALYSYIKGHGYDGSITFHQLVEEFQKAANTVLLGTAYKYGKLNEDGAFDVTTASALAQTTLDPLPPDPNAPVFEAVKFPTPIDVNASSLSQDAGFLLKLYIMKNGDNMRNPGQMVLTKVFQHAINTDPKFPGQGWALTATRNGIIGMLQEDGLLGAASKAQLYRDESQSEFNSEHAS